MSIAAPPEASRSITHYRCKKDFFCKIQYEVAEQQARYVQLVLITSMSSFWQVAKSEWEPEL